MGIRRLDERIMNNGICAAIRRFLHSPLYPVLCGGVSLFCYYLGLDMLAVWYLCLSASAVLVLGGDATPVFANLLFANVLASREHSPSLAIEASDYYSEPINLAFMAIAVIILLFVMGLRVFQAIKGGRFKPNAIFFGLCALAAAMLFNGFLSSDYDAKNLLYALVFGAILIGGYVFGCCCLNTDGDAFKKLSIILTVFCGVLAIELFAAYGTYEGLIVDGKVIKDKLYFGWGTWNQMGMLLTLCLPAWFYLAGIFKYGWAFILGGTANLALAFMCMSRQAMLFASILYVLCCVWTLVRVKGRQRIITACVLGGTAAVCAIIVGVLHTEIFRLLGSVSINLADGSGRTQIWKEGVARFLHSPLFGDGFFGDIMKNDESLAGVGFLPIMHHNTFVQLFAATGVAGTAAYIFHRAQTVISLFNNLSHERVFLALTAGAILLTSLLDNHLFYVLPTLVYALLLGVFIKSEKDGKNNNAREDAQEKERNEDKNTQTLTCGDGAEQVQVAAEQAEENDERRQ